MRHSNQQTLGEVIKEFLKNFGLEEKVTEARIAEAWEKIMGPGIARYTKRISLRNKTLTIQLSSPALRQELSYGKTKIIKMINEAVGKDVVEELILC
jgi:predicted nucleic acid-binding Zn ribbon protein